MEKGRQSVVCLWLLGAKPTTCGLSLAGGALSAFSCLRKGDSLWSVFGYLEQGWQFAVCQRLLVVCFRPLGACGQTTVNRSEVIL